MGIDPAVPYGSLSRHSALAIHAFAAPHAKAWMAAALVDVCGA